MKTRTTTQILARARQLADAETPDGTVDLETDAELLTYLNEAYDELIDEVIEHNGLDLLVTSTTLTTPYTLPTTFYKDVALEVPDGDGYYDELPRFNFRERNRYRDTDKPAWRVLNGALKLFPEAAAPSSMRLWYIPNVVDFTAGASVQVWNGWDTFLSARVAMKILTKEGRHSSELQDEYKIAVRRVRRACNECHSGQPEQVPDLHRVAEDYFDEDLPTLE